ncbi:MAG: hypothetical protein PUP91_13785 [Rhizonema sp. PD37]|nr:hypothetical protein [Rhizonema sp. PD37]
MCQPCQAMTKQELRSELGDLLSTIDYCRCEPLIAAMVQEEYDEAEAAIIKLVYKFVDAYFSEENILRTGDIMSDDSIYQG